MSVTVCKVSVTAIILLTSLTLNTSKPLIRLSSCCDIILHTLHNYDKLFYNHCFFCIYLCDDSVHNVLFIDTLWVAEAP